jgi:hypothetical protein
MSNPVFQKSAAALSVSLTGAGFSSVAAGAREDRLDEVVDLHAGLLSHDVDGLVDELVEVPVHERGVVLDGQRQLVVGDLGDRRGVEADPCCRRTRSTACPKWPRRSRGRASRRRRCPT